MRIGNTLTRARRVANSDRSRPKENTFSPARKIEWSREKYAYRNPGWPQQAASQDQGTADISSPDARFRHRLEFRWPLL
jgi:hypothetical protein